MLPQRPEIIIPQALPAAVVTDKTGIEPKYFGSSDYFCWTASAERSNDVGDVCCLKDAEVVCDGWSAHFARAGQTACVKDTSALFHDKFGESLERVSALQVEQFLDIPGPVIAFQMFLRQKERGRPPRRRRRLRSVSFASSISRRHIGVSQTSFLRPTSVSLNFLEAPRWHAGEQETTSYRTRMVLAAHRGSHRCA